MRDNLQPQITVDLAQCDDVACSKCEGLVFTPLIRAKRIPGIQIAQPQDQPHMMQMLVCSQCGTAFDETWEKVLAEGAEAKDSDSIIIKP